MDQDTWIPFPDLQPIGTITSGKSLNLLGVCVHQLQIGDDKPCPFCLLGEEG